MKVLRQGQCVFDVQKITTMDRSLWTTAEAVTFVIYRLDVYEGVSALTMFCDFA